MNKILQEIVKIDPSKQCINFIAERIKSNNYRGIQISQHNRYTKKEILIILHEIYNLVGKNLMQIRTTDLSKRPINIDGEEKYAELINNISSKISRGSQDSLRKNIFVDMNRMGLINRYNKNKEISNPFKRETKKYISISNLGISLLKEKNIFSQNLLFTRALENLLKGFGEEILNIALELGSKMPYISKYELLLFASFLNQKLNDKTYSRSLIINFIKEYRRLSKYQKNSLIHKLQTYCNPDNFLGNKTQKRDFHNWLNETQQIITLLSQMSYFEYDEEKDRLVIRIGKNGIYENKAKLKRSIIEKRKYFKEHGIVKSDGFELHHVVPLCWAKSIIEFQILDNWKNLVYIDAFSHAQITHNNNANVILKFTDDYVIFIDFENKEVKCKKYIDISYDDSKQDIMLEYNKRLLEAKES